MQNQWIVRPAVVPSSDLIAEVGGHPLVAGLLAQRGIESATLARAFLNPDHYSPSPPEALRGLEQAAQVILRALAARHHLLVWGDFDVDGQTSTALLVSALRDLIDEAHVTFYVPNRFTDGHGMKMPRLQEVIEAKSPRPELIVTCDTGITDAEGITWAREQGIQVVITDHHDLPEELKRLEPAVDALWDQPAEAVGVSVRRANALLDPMLSPLDSPLRTLPGVGVAYKLVQRLYEMTGSPGKDEELLDLVALGIVADVAQQVNDTRYLLQRGIERLRSTEREGLIALMEVARVMPARVSAENIAFQLGPRLNALGRLEDATPSIEMLSTRDIFRARQLAAQLEGLNQDRRRLTRETTSEALKMVEASPALLDLNALVLAHERWHAGIVGIVASRMVEEFGKPALLLLLPPGEPARGSARSIPGVDIGAAIAACAPLLIGHGGHAGAAGVTLLPQNIERFRQELSRQVALHTDDDVQQGLQLDAVLAFDAINLSLVHSLNRLAPFGAGNPQPRFLSRNLAIQSDSRLGAEGTHRRLLLKQTNAKGKEVSLQAIWFNGGDAELPAGAVDLAYTLSINRYRDSESVQLQVIAIRPSESNESSHHERWIAPSRIYDLRHTAASVAELPPPQAAAWFAEGAIVGQAGSLPQFHARHEAFAAPMSQLVFWSIPPSQELHQRILEAVQPDIVYLCGQVTSVDEWESVRDLVGGMALHAIKLGVAADVQRMASRIGATLAIVRLAIQWLASKGAISLGEWRGDQVTIMRGPGVPRAMASEDTASLVRGEDDLFVSSADIEAQARLLIREMRTWRTFYQRAPLSSLGFRQGAHK